MTEDTAGEKSEETVEPQAQPQAEAKAEPQAEEKPAEEKPSEQKPAEENKIIEITVLIHFASNRMRDIKNDSHSIRVVYNLHTNY